MPEPKLQRATERYGLGQSGYTAGRVENDLALEEQLEDRNAAYVKPEKEDELEPLELGEDDRWYGRGGKRWVPKSP